MLRVPIAKLSAEDPAAAKRKEIADKLRNGEEVRITNSGQVVSPFDQEALDGKTLKAPEGKLA